jgi:hypothetical protein
MEFDKKNHTKNYLMNNSSVLFSLAQNSEDFRHSDLCKDVEILNSLKNDFYPLAEILALDYRDWVVNTAIHDQEILSIRNVYGMTISQVIACRYPELLLNDDFINDKSLKTTSEVYGSLAQFILNQYKSKGDILFRFVRAGHVLNMKSECYDFYTPKLTVEDVNLFIKNSISFMLLETNSSKLEKFKIDFYRTLATILEGVGKKFKSKLIIDANYYRNCNMYSL